MPQITEAIREAFPVERQVAMLCLLGTGVPGSFTPRLDPAPRVLPKSLARGRILCPTSVFRSRYSQVTQHTAVPDAFSA